MKIEQKESNMKKLDKYVVISWNHIEKTLVLQKPQSRVQKKKAKKYHG